MRTNINQTLTDSHRTLVIDWGNSTLKTGWFQGDTLVKTDRFSSLDALLDELKERSVDYVLASSTSRPADEIRTQLMKLTTDFFVLDSQTLLPIRNAYDTPTTLGADRVAAATGASVLFPDRHCLVLDLGTCLTADFLNRNSVFQGGLISPGMRMRFRAMHEQTARLPLVEASYEWPALTATNTQQGLQSGVMNGLLFELNGIIENYRREWPDIIVLTCGGDMAAFESRLKPPIFAVPELVLIGLNRILRYNVEHIQANRPDYNA